MRKKSQTILDCKLPGARNWIVSKRFDISILLIPLLGSLAALTTLDLKNQAVPLWAFLLIIVSADVAHVWTTLYITYLDRDIFKQRRRLFLLPIPVSIIVSYSLHSYSPSLFWTLLAYIAIFHFIKQQWGFIALYKSRAKETRSLDYYLDKWTLWIGALGPVLLWHASPSRQFDWFNAGESFIAKVPRELRPDIVAVCVFFAVTWTLRQIWLLTKHQEFNPGKWMWMSLSWLSWWVGISMTEHPVISAAFLNLFHGVPFIALVWFRCNQKWQNQTPQSSKLVSWLSQKKHWLHFLALVILIAAIEETLWDGIVWHVYLPNLLQNNSSTSVSSMSIWVALLSTPQIVHYYLDAWIWKLDGSNPELSKLLKI